MIRALLESLWLFYLVGAVLWGYLGLLAASSQRMPIIVGVLAGIFFWFLGVLIVYVAGFIRARAARLPRHPVSGRSTPALIAGLAAAGTMLVTVALPWGSGRVAWSRDQQHVTGNLQPMHFTGAAVAILLSAAVVASVVVLDSQIRRGIWLGIGAVVMSFWFSLLAEWITLDSGLNNASDAVSSATGRAANVSFNAAAGAWLMLAMCVVVFAWLTWRTVTLLTERRTAPTTGSAPGWPPTHMPGLGTSNQSQGWGSPDSRPGINSQRPGWGQPKSSDGWGTPGGQPETRSPW